MYYSLRNSLVALLESLFAQSEEDLAEETRYNFNLVSFFVNRFWGRRPDGVANNEDLPQQIVNILEFKQSTDREKGLFEMKEAEANEQHKDIISAF